MIASSTHIRDAIIKQVSLQKFSISDVARDSEFYGYPISRSRLSTYWNYTTGITQRDILWLCLRYGVEVKITVYVEQVNKTTLRMRIKNFMKKWNISYP